MQDMFSQNTVNIGNEGHCYKEQWDIKETFPALFPIEKSVANISGYKGQNSLITEYHLYPRFTLVRYIRGYIINGVRYNEV